MNSIQRFIFKDLNIRGQVLKIDDAWQKMCHQRGYTASIQSLMGELTALTLVLGNGMKHKGKVTTQVQGKGPVNLLVVETNQNLDLRGVAKTNQPVTNESTADELLGDGQIMVTLNNAVTDHTFQSFVPREGGSLIQSFENYFSQSEQLPTKLWIASNAHSLAAVMIQKLPDTEKVDPDGWDRIMSLADTLTDEELVSLAPQDVLHRLFHEEVIELFEDRPIQYVCPQEREKFKVLIQGLGEKEARSILKEQGEIVIHNEICNHHERFNEADITDLFAEQKTDKKVKQTS